MYSSLFLTGDIMWSTVSSSGSLDFTEVGDGLYLEL